MAGGDSTYQQPVVGRRGWLTAGGGSGVGVDGRARSGLARWTARFCLGQVGEGPVGGPASGAVPRREGASTWHSAPGTDVYCTEYLRSMVWYRRWRSAQHGWQSSAPCTALRHLVTQGGCGSQHGHPPLSPSPDAWLVRCEPRHASLPAPILSVVRASFLSWSSCPARQT